MIIDNVVYIYRETVPNMQYTAVLLLCTDSTQLCVYCGHMHGMKSNQIIQIIYFVQEYLTSTYCR